VPRVLPLLVCLLLLPAALAAATEPVAWDPALAEGKGEAETRPLFEALYDGRFRAELAGSPVFFKGPVVEAIGVAIRLFDQLHAYYGPTRRELLPPLHPDGV
jgi:hypothetical protein